MIMNNIRFDNKYTPQTHVCKFGCEFGSHEVAVVLIGAGGVLLGEEVDLKSDRGYAALLHVERVGGHCHLLVDTAQYKYIFAFSMIRIGYLSTAHFRKFIPNPRLPLRSQRLIILRWDKTPIKMIDNEDSQPWNAGIAYARHDEILTWPSRNLPYDYFNIQIKRIIIWFEARVQSEHETLPPCLPVNEVWWSDPNLLCLRQPCWSWTGCQRGTWSPSSCETCF